MTTLACRSYQHCWRAASVSVCLRCGAIEPTREPRMIAGLSVMWQTSASAMPCTLISGCATSPPSIPVVEGSEGVRVVEDLRILGLAGCETLGRIEAEDGKVARDSSRYVGTNEKALARLENEAAKLGGDTAAIEQRPATFRYAAPAARLRLNAHLQTGFAPSTCPEAVPTRTGASSSSDCVD